MTEAISIGSPAKSRTERMLDGVEKVGNKVPHPVIMFLYLIAFIAVLSTSWRRSTWGHRDGGGAGPDAGAARPSEQLGG